MYEIHLTGCNPVPLASYLKALGIHRLVAEQEDPDALGRWAGEHFVLESRLDEDDLKAFLLEEYRPTPIVAPWNGGSGFYPKDNQDGIQPIEKGSAARTEVYRNVIRKCRGLVDDLGLEQRPTGQEKADFLARLRGELAEDVLPWFDAAVVLSSDDPKYPPLLGTGGNDGRLDFTNNFMQRLRELFDLLEEGGPRAIAERWLPGSLLGLATPAMSSAAVGQFAPGGVGGPNSTTGFTADSFVNPWDFVLMLEGALLFAAVTTRRLEQSDSGALSYPFTVHPTSAGSHTGTLAEEGAARGEIWLPLWSRPANLSELKTVLSEGRVTIGKRPAEDGLDFTRTVVSLGVDRGIESFQRYVFQQRSGRAYLATPVARLKVRRNPDADLIKDLDRFGFLDRLRRAVRKDETPGRIKELGRRLEDALFRLTQSSEPEVFQSVLVLLGQIQRAVAVSPEIRKRVPPVPRLRGAWVKAADDRSHEFRLAASLAGLYATEDSHEDESEKDGSPDEKRIKWVLPMRVHLARIESGAYRDRWAPESRLAVWAASDLSRDLVDVLERRMLEADRLEFASKPLFGKPAADLAAIAAFLDEETDDVRIGALVPGLSHIRSPGWLPTRNTEADHIPAAYTVLKPLFVPDAILQEARLLRPDLGLELPRRLIGKLRANDVEGAVQLGWHRLRVSGMGLPNHPQKAPAAPYPDGRRLAAALMVPIDIGNVIQVARRAGLGRLKQEGAEAPT